MNSFDTENRARWNNAIHSAFPIEVPTSESWSDVNSIFRILRCFCEDNLNHTLLPGGGGNDFNAINTSRESKCIELAVSLNYVYLCKPAKLYFEYFKQSPTETFLLLETSKLAPSGIYNSASRQIEELLDLEGEYMDPRVLDEDNTSYDDNGEEIPDQRSKRLVHRILSGKLLVVAKRSLWNRDVATYDGRHNNMSCRDIRKQIESLL